MKNLIRFVFMTAMLLFYYNSDAQFAISNGATYYVCQGVSYTFEFSFSGPRVEKPYYWIFDTERYVCGSPPCSFSDGVVVHDILATWIYNCPDNTGDSDYYGFDATFNTTFPVKITVPVVSCPSSEENVTFTIVPYISQITGDTGICGAGPGTYTVNVNGGLDVTAYQWTLPDFLSGTSTTNVISVIGSATSLLYGTIIATGNGCPAGSPSNVSYFYTYDVPTAPSSAPGGTLDYLQYGRSCWWDGFVPAVPNAAEYQWCFDSTFSPTYSITTTPTTTTGPFLLDEHTYTVYVRGTNKCGPGPFTKYIKETPEAPTGCIPQPIERETNQKQVTEYTIYKVYPNPVSNQLIIEYPIVQANSNLNLFIYNMLGQEIISYNLPANENTVSENISALPPGIYMYEIVSGNSAVTRDKIIIQR